MSDIEKQHTLHKLAQRKAASSGFTMVEIMMVMMVIALMAAATVAGKEMIAQAAIRRQVTQIDQIEAAVRSFRVKYNCYPGDCADPTIISGYTYAGNGDGYLAATWNDDENKGFWIHLSASNLLFDSLKSHSQLAGMNVPQMVLNHEGVINAFGNLTYAQNVLELATTSVSGALKTDEIRQIDAKMDDGIAASGSIRSTGYGSGSTTVYAAAPIFPLANTNDSGSTQCLSGGVYSTSATTGFCNMIYILGQ